MNHYSVPYRIFSVINYIVLSVIAITCIVPLIHILAVSFSAKAAADANVVGLLPIHFTIEAYKFTLNNSNFIRSLWIGIERTLLGTSISMFLVVITAYPLSKESSAFPGRTIYTWFFVFTMLFSGGLVPSYMLVQTLGLMNTIWALVLPGAMAVWNTILMLNFFRTIPKDLEEAALIDGASHFRTLFSIYLPIAKPAIATIVLFSMVGQWNSWFDGLIYITDSTRYPLATFLQTIIVQQDFSKLNVTKDDLANVAQATVKASQIFIGAFPILMVYPFLQRYFVKGIVIGAVKE